MRGKKLTLLLAGCLGLTLMAGCGKSGNPAEALKERYSQYVDLGTYKGIKYTPTETPVTSEDVDAQVNQLVTQNGKKVENRAQDNDDNMPHCLAKLNSRPSSEHIFEALIKDDDKQVNQSDDKKHVHI